MMGKKTVSSKLFYGFSLERRVPDGHLLRRVNAAVDFSFVRRLTARFYSHTGQPSVDPVVVFRMALLGYLYGIVSERRLVEEISLNLAYLWFIGYDLDEAVPVHSALSKARRRFGPTLYLAFFTEIVRQCEKAGLIQGRKIYADSTLVEANADEDTIGSRVLIAQLPDVNEHVAQLWRQNPDPPQPVEDGQPSVPPGQSASGAGPAELSASASAGPAVEAVPTAPESETALEQRAGVAKEADREANRSALHLAGPGDQPTKVNSLINERMISRVDPEAELVSRARVLAGLYYKIHAAVDGGRARVVTAVEVTGGAVPDDQLLSRIVQEHVGNVGRQVGEVVADAKYGTVDNYRQLEERGIRASIPMVDNGANNREVPAKAFHYDPQSDSFVCPEGQRLTRQGITRQTASHPLIIYRTKPKLCASCAQKAACCGEAKTRSVSRPEDGGVREREEAYLQTFAARQSIRWRKAWIETIFGDGKERRGMERAHYRGLDWMRVQAYMIAIAQNVRQLALRKRTRPEQGVGALENPPHFFVFFWLWRLHHAIRPVHCP